MYRIIKVLNNNGLLVYHNETGRELIFLGSGVGFGKKPTQQVAEIPGAKVYSLVTRRKEQSVLKVVNGIRPEFIEVAGRIIEEAESVFQEISHDILLPMADHIALAAKRAEENRQIPNPFTPDIRETLLETPLERLILKTEDLLAASGQRIQDAAQAAYQNGNITRDSYLAILAERKGKGGNNHEANI